MSDTMIKDMTKEELTAIVIDENSHVITDADWQMLDSEVDAINKDQRTRSAGSNPVGTSTHQEIVGCLWRVDHKTHRLIQEGFMCLEDSALFADENDAVAYINEVTGENFKDFSDAAEAAEMGEIGDCYETDWL